MALSTTEPAPMDFTDNLKSFAKEHGVSLEAERARVSRLKRRCRDIWYPGSMHRELLATMPEDTAERLAFLYFCTKADDYPEFRLVVVTVPLEEKKHGLPDPYAEMRKLRDSYPEGYFHP